MVRTPPQPRRFALGTLADGDREFPALVVGDRALDLAPDGVLDHPPGLPRTVNGILAAWDRHLPRLTELAQDTRPGLQWSDHAAFAVRAPLSPGQVLQSGANYRTHVIDLAVAHRNPAGPHEEAAARTEVAAMMDRRAAEGTPYLFAGLPSAVTGPCDDLVLPAYSTQHDWELELAAVIGRPAFRVTREQALDHVAGYTIANDVTTRDLVFRTDMPEIGTDWLRAKNAPGFLPLGPLLVPAHCIADPGDLRVHLRVNGETMQDETTADMLFDTAALVAAASQTVRLAPGDLVLTGSPAGNGMAAGRFLGAGDVMEGTITGLGTQRTVCRAEQ